MNKKQYRGLNFWLQVLVWIAFFLMPMMLLEPDEPPTLRNYLLKCMAPLSMMIVFYTTYLWLMPAYLKGEKWQFWVINIALVVVLSFSHHQVLSYFWHKDHPVEMMSKHPKPKNKPIIRIDILMVAREIFYLSIVAGVSASVVLSKRWATTEEARQKAESARTQAELDSLRHQVNPHFLLNTLNNIYALTAFDQTKAQKAIMELSKILRHILYDSQEAFIPLDEEVKFLENYINLMKMRISNKVEIRTNFSIPTSNTFQIAPMILISLVENAFKHGISPSENSFIDISIQANKKLICCMVENSNFPKSEKDHSGHGIGLRQVAKRLELSYPKKYLWEKGITNKNTYLSRITLYDTKMRNH